MNTKINLVSRGFILATFLLFLCFPISHAQISIQIDDGTGAPADYNVPGWRTNQGLLKLGEIIHHSEPNLGIGHWDPSIGNNFSGNIGQYRQFNLQVERGNFAHLLMESDQSTAFGTRPDDIWSTIGVKLTGPANFYGYRGQWNEYGVKLGLQAEDGALVLGPDGVEPNGNVLGTLNALVGWGSFNEDGGGSNRLKFSYFNNQNEEEKMTILANGNVGIGTSNPLFKLHTSAVVFGPPLDPPTDGPIIANFQNPRTFDQWSLIGSYDAYATVQNYFGKAHIGMHDDKHIKIGSRVTANGGIGNVQITVGNSVPRLSISNNEVYAHRDFVVGAEGRKWIFHTQYWDQNNRFLSIAPQDGSSWDFDRAVSFWRNGPYTMTVEGKLGAREIEVTLAAWPDYVFADDYELMPLDKVAEFIAENHRLPGIPSEKEVVENGLNVGEMMKLQMEKIEELTLYLLELKKENKELREMFNELR